MVMTVRRGYGCCVTDSQHTVFRNWKHVFMTAWPMEHETIGSWRDLVQEMKDIAASLPDPESPLMGWSRMQVYGPGDDGFNVGAFCIEMWLTEEAYVVLRETLDAREQPFLHPIFLWEAKI